MIKNVSPDSVCTFIGETSSVLKFSSCSGFRITSGWLTVTALISTGQYLVSRTPAGLYSQLSSMLRAISATSGSLARETASCAFAASGLEGPLLGCDRIATGLVDGPADECIPEAKEKTNLNLAKSNLNPLNDIRGNFFYSDWFIKLLKGKLRAQCSLTQRHDGKMS